MFEGIFLNSSFDSMGKTHTSQDYQINCLNHTFNKLWYIIELWITILKSFFSFFCSSGTSTFGPLWCKNGGRDRYDRRTDRCTAALTPASVSQFRKSLEYDSVECELSISEHFSALCQDMSGFVSRLFWRKNK